MFFLDIYHLKIAFEPPSLEVSDGAVLDVRRFLPRTAFSEERINELIRAVPGRKRLLKQNMPELSRVAFVKAVLRGPGCTLSAHRLETRREERSTYFVGQTEVEKALCSNGVRKLAIYPGNYWSFI